MLPVVGGAMLAGALGWALNAMLTVRSARIALANVENQLRSAVAEDRRLTAQMAVAKTKAAEADEALAALTMAGPLRSPEQPKPSVPSRVVTSHQDAIAKDPKLQALALRSNRASLIQRYGALFQSLQLSAEKVQRFSDIAMKRTEQNMDLTGIQQMDGADVGAVAAMRKKVDDDYRAAQKELLGNHGFQQLQEFERTMQPRTVVRNLAGAASMNGIGLTPQQADQLMHALAGGSEGYRRGGNASVAEIDWSKADAQAAQILSPAQLALFQSIEPLGGGGSRWLSQLGQALDRAKKKLPAASSARPSGG
jgi:hypothetical protein